MIQYISPVRSSCRLVLKSRLHLINKAWQHVCLYCSLINCHKDKFLFAVSSLEFIIIMLRDGTRSHSVSDLSLHTVRTLFFSSLFVEHYTGDQERETMPYLTCFHSLHSFCLMCSMSIFSRRVTSIDERDFPIICSPVRLSDKRSSSSITIPIQLSSMFNVSASLILITCIVPAHADKCPVRQHLSFSSCLIKILDTALLSNSNTNQSDDRVCRTNVDSLEWLDENVMQVTFSASLMSKWSWTCDAPLHPSSFFFHSALGDGEHCQGFDSAHTWSLIRLATSACERETDENRPAGFLPENKLVVFLDMSFL